MDRRELLSSMVAMLAATVAGAEPARAGGFRPAGQAPAKAPGAVGAGKSAAGARPVTLPDFEPLAQRRISRMAYEYIAGGGADEITLRRNRAAFDDLRLKPRVLKDVSRLDTRLDLLGRKLEYPILLAPTAYHKLVHPRGEVATAEGAGAAGALMVLSSFATTSVEEVARAARSPWWFQLYSMPDRAFTRDLVQRAEAAGATALVITVDTPVLPTRDRETRSNFALPPGMAIENLRPLLEKNKQLDASHRGKGGGIYSDVLNPQFTWETVAWVRSFAKVPVLLKGIVAPEDARIAAEHQVGGIIVSNHGGRNLDTSPATIEALPRINEAVLGRVPLLLDGGVRRGTDVVKALALGAQAVLIGRPYLWALSVEGATGVQRVCEILRTELEAALALCGVTSLEQVDRRVLW
jgi:4-hydroxymandelate oxidase